MFILIHPINFPCGRKPEHQEKTHNFRQSVDWLFPHVSIARIELTTSEVKGACSDDCPTIIEYHITFNNEALSEVLRKTGEQGIFCSGNTRTKPKSHTENKGTRKLGVQGNMVKFLLRKRKQSEHKVNSFLPPHTSILQHFASPLCTLSPSIWSTKVENVHEWFTSHENARRKNSVFVAFYTNLPRDLPPPVRSPLTTTRNLELYKSCMPYMACNKN